MRKNELSRLWLVAIILAVMQLLTLPSAFSAESNQNITNSDSIYVTFPRCYEWFIINQVQNITWEAPSDVAAMRLQYTVDNGASWQEITAHTPNDGLYSWLVPDQVSASFLVRISNAEDSTKFGMSKSPSIIAPDALVHFTDYEHNPIFEQDSVGAWDENLRERGWFLFENGTYFQWFSGWQGEYDKFDSNRISPGLALSPDGVTWTRVADSALFVDGWVEDVCIVKNDTVYYMYAEDEYDGSTLGAHINLYTSVNKTDWALVGTVLTPEGSGWESADVGTPTVWIENDVWYMLYEGIGGGTKGQVGLATSADGVNWVRNSHNPVLANPFGDHRHIAIDSRIKVGETTFIYGHYQLENKEYVGGVFASDDLITWTPYSGNPITGNSPVIVDNGDQYLLYSWNEQAGTYNLSYSTLPPVPDTSGSEIYDVIVQNINATSVEIAWKTREAAPSIIDYGLTTAYGSSDHEETSTTSHFKLLTGLAPNSTYHFRLRSALTVEPHNCSPDYAFTTARSTDPVVYIRRVNAGGPSYVKNDEYWHTDQPFEGNAWGYEDSEGIYTTPDSVLGSNYGFIYRSERWGQQSYHFTVPANGRYRVTLHFAEIWYSANQKRVFDAWLENTLAIANLDIYKTIGHDRALAVIFELEIEDGEVTIALTSHIEDPKIAGIEVEKIPSTQIAVDISAREVENVSPQRVNLTWDTDILTTSQISFGVYPQLNTMTAEEASARTEHVVAFKDLLPDTKYAYRIISKNATGVYTIHDNMDFTTVDDGILAMAHIQRVFEDNCVKCHTGMQPPANLNLESGQAWNNLYDMPALEAPQWKRVVPGDRDASWLFEKITNDHPAVGEKMGRLSEGDVELLGQWIDQGAHRETETPMPLLQILTSKLPDGEVNLAYSTKVNGTGGNPPWHFALSRGVLPQGLALDTETGIIAGVPVESGSFEFKIELLDSFDEPDSVCQEFTLVINPVSPKWQLPAEFQLQTVATDFDRPTSIAFAPPSSQESFAPLFYVAERFGTIFTVARDYSKQIYAWNLLNFDPNGNFPDSGNLGLSGLCVEPQSGDVFAAAVYDSAGFKLAKIIRYQSQDGGRTAAQQETILSGVAARMSHGINELAFGPDGKLYALVGDNWQPELAEDSDYANGKVLRMNSDGSA
ncbi:PQQ-dependent sugar dehydrogenase, partial [candidate division KSB1 bacterium]|nr:PQQ-dependent sugar dehydrogenase [candidate division KSB1 bacterium]